MLTKIQFLAAWLHTELRRDEGATAVEYGVMVAAIIAVIVTVVFAIGVKVNTAFTTVDSALP